MFGGFTKVLVILTACIIGWAVYQSNQIDSLKAENQTQAQTITQLELEQLTLQTALEAERQAVEKQQEIANALRTQTEKRRETVKTILVKEPCAATPLPRGIIEQLH